MSIENPNTEKSQSRLSVSAPLLDFAWVLVLIILTLVVRFMVMSLATTNYDYESAKWLRGEALSTRNYLCNRLSICEPYTTPETAYDINTIGELLYSDLTGRLGVPLTLSGIFMALHPISPDRPLIQQLEVAAHYSHFFADILSIVLLWFIVQCMNFPRWISVIVGLTFASSIPFALESVTIMREPFSRMFFLIALFGYLCALRTDSRNIGILGVTIGSIGAVLTAYSNNPYRPIMWILFLTFLCLAFIRNRHRWTLILFQLVLISALLIGLVGLLRIVKNPDVIQPEMTWTNKLYFAFTGLDNSGEVSGMTTIMTCEAFWCVHFTDDITASSSILTDFKSNPTEFVNRLLYSIFANVSGLNNPYQQETILTLPQQLFQHRLVLLLALFGIAWMCGHFRTYWIELILFGVCASFFILAFSIISIETRRLPIVIQLCFIAFAIYIFSLSLLWKLTPRYVLAALLSIVIATFVYLTPFAIWLWLLPLSANATSAVVFVIKTITGCGVIAVHLWLWHRQDSRFSYWLGGGFLLISFSFILISDLWEQNEYQWASRVNGGISIQQTMPVRNTAEPLWLIIDVRTPQEAMSLEIAVADTIIKPTGEAMALYEAPSTIVVRHYARTTFTRYRYWHAVRIPSAILSENVVNNNLTVTIRSGESAIIYGSYLDKEGFYTGPGININVDSSFGTLLYDNFEGRVTRRFDVSGIASSWSNGSFVTQGDLSPSVGVQTGIYRIFLVPEPAEAIVSAEEVAQLFRLNPTPSAP
jgi:hypothetical protein